MKHHQQMNMVHRVHKNVKYMLSEVSQIAKLKHKLPIIIKRNQACLEELAPHIDRFTNKLAAPYEVKGAIQKYRKIRSKQRPVSLIYQTSSEAQPQMKSSNNIKKLENSKLQQSQQISPCSSLNRQEAELVDPSYRKSLRNCSQMRQNNQILPSIIKNRRERRSTESANKYCFTLSTEALQELIDPRSKNIKTIESTSSSNLLSYLQRNRMKSNPFALNKKGKKKQPTPPSIKYDLYGEPWRNQYQEGDLIF